MDIQKQLQKISFFEALTTEQLKELVQIGETKEVTDGTLLLKKGEKTDGLYLLLEGQIRVVAKVSEDHESELRLKAGDFFGQQALFENRTLMANVESIETSKIFKIKRVDFLSLISNSSEMLLKILTCVSHQFERNKVKFYRQMQEKGKLEYRMKIDQYRSMGDMVTGVAHEMNTPLGMITTASSFISSCLTSENIGTLAKDEQAKETLESLVETTSLIQSNVAKVNKLVQTFKKISISQMAENIENIDLPATIKEIIEILQIGANSFEFEFQNLLSPEENSQWKGYSGYLTQILMQLLENIKLYAYPEGSGKIKIILSQEKQEQDLTSTKQGLTQFFNTQIIDGQKEERACFTLAVRDYGKGIAPENLPKIFDPFFTSASGTGGTGLGMAIVHNLVTSGLKGDIAIQSKLEKGTTVSFTFPQEIIE